MSQLQSENSIKDHSATKEWSVFGIRISHAVSHMEEYKTFVGKNDSDVIRLHFGLKGDYRFVYKQLDQSFDLIGGHHNVMYSAGIDLEIENKSLQIETFGVDLPKSLFLDYVEESGDLIQPFVEKIRVGKASILSKKWGGINTEVQNIIDEIIQNPYQGAIQKTYLFGKCFELLALCFDQYCDSKSELYLKKKLDREKIIAARDFINSRLMNPPSLMEISKKIGMNEFKLKKGFKETFENTVFGYLNGRRLSLAKQTLLDTQKTVAEVAFEFGYSSPQHFSTQFRKNFGVTPKSIRKNP